jgi:hypothetical protein
MADENPLIGKGFDPYVDTRLNAGGTAEYFNKQTGQGFASPDELVNYVKPYVAGVNSGNVFDVVKKGIELPKEVPAATLENPTSPNDVNSLIADNRKIRDQLLQNLSPTADETGLQKQLFALQNEARSTELNAQAGLNTIEDKPIGTGFITGQQASLQRQANLALQTNAFKQEPIVQNLQLLQQNRQSIIEKLNAQIGFGQTDINLAMQLKQMDNEQQKAAQEFALKYRVTAPAYSYDGKTVYNTQTGKAYSNEQEFFKEFGFTNWKEVPPNFIQREFITDEQRNADRSFALQQDQFGFQKAQTNVDNTFRDKEFARGNFEADRNFALQETQAALQGKSFGKIGVDDLGNDKYGFIDLINGTTNTGSVGGSNTNFGKQKGSISGLPAFDTLSANPGVNRSDRNNNPGNIKVSEFTKSFEGVVGVEANKAADSGNFLIFNSSQDGFNAMGKLLSNTNYTKLTAEQAIKRWNGGGAYGAATVGLDPGKNFGQQIQDPVKLQQVVQAMAKAEGYKGVGGSAAPTTGNDVISQSFSSIAPRLSADGRKSAQATINNYIKNGDTEGAKQFIISTAISSLPAEQQNKAFGRTVAIDALNNIESLLAQFQAKGGNTGLLTGSAEQIAQKIGRTSNPDLANIGNQITASIAAYRNAVSGAAFTEQEGRMYEGMFPSTSNAADLNKAKINSLRDMFNGTQKSVLATVIGERNYDGLMASNNFQSYAQSAQSVSPESQYAASILSTKQPISPRGAPAQTKSTAPAKILGNSVSNAVGTLPFIGPVFNAAKSSGLLSKGINAIKNIFK